MSEEKRNFPTPLVLISLVIGLVIILGLGYFFLNRDSKGTQETQDATESTTEVEQMVETTDQETIVVFKDEILENHVREELGIPTGDITSTDMLDLYLLSISELGVTDLTGLEYALGLAEFTLARENVKSLEPLKNLASLERFSLRYSEIEELPIEFSKDVNLNHVSIVNTQINDVTFLTHMTNVDHLTMTDAGITDISALENLNNVQQLNIRGNDVKDISSLSGMNNLEILNLQHNNVSDISPLEGLEKLYDLVLSYNPITNLKATESLPSLQTLIVYLDHEVKHVIFDQVKTLENMGIDVEYHR